MIKAIHVEDDPLVARMYQKNFDDGGFDVQIAESAEKALDMFGTFKPDLIILDIMLPDMNGMDLLEKLKGSEELKSIPVIMLTNLSGVAYRSEAMGKGAIGYLVKAELKPKDVVAQIQKLMAKVKPAAPPQAPPTPAPEVK